jgi:hypothetical protein
MCSSRSVSASEIRVTGMPVHIATTWAISSSSTVGASPAIVVCHSPRRASTFSRSVASSSRSLAAAS